MDNENHQANQAISTATPSHRILAQDMCHMAYGNPVRCPRDSEISELHRTLREIREDIKGMKDGVSKTAVLVEQASRFRAELESMDKRIHRLELDFQTHKGMSQWLFRIVWAIIAAMAGGAVMFFKLPV